MAFRFAADCGGTVWPKVVPAKPRTITRIATVIIRVFINCLNSRSCIASGRAQGRFALRICHWYRANRSWPQRYACYRMAIDGGLSVQAETCERFERRWPLTEDSVADVAIRHRRGYTTVTACQLLAL